MEVPDSNSPSVRVAFEGCGHGCLHEIYASVGRSATLKGWDDVDLVVIGGDFQAVRNSNDLACMAVPIKYREIGDFHEYYSGKRTAPYLTIFIGGNHEASNHLSELYYGGWVAPNIYYMGAANVLRFGPLRIAGLSGIFKGYDYRKPHFERLPYSDEEKRSIFHVRELDVRKLLQIRTQTDLGLSHDWPRGIEYSGDYERLFRIKKDFRHDSERGYLGSPAAKNVLDRLRPAHWFSAHYHIKFTGSIQHGQYAIPFGHKVQLTSQRDPLPPQKLPYMFGMDGASVSRGLNDFIEGGSPEPEGRQPEPEEKQPEPEGKHEPEEGKHEPEGNQSSSAHTGNEVTNTEATTLSSETSTLNPEATAFNPSSDEKPSDVVAQQTPEHGSLAAISTRGSGKNQNDTSQQGLGDTTNRISAWKNFHNVAATQEAEENSRFLLEQNKTQEAVRNIQHNLIWRQVDIDHDGTRRRLGMEGSESGDGPENKKQKISHDANTVKNADEIDLDLSDSDQEDQAKIAPSVETKKPAQISENTGKSGVVSQDIRNQLPASFARSAQISENTGKPGVVSQDIRNQLPASFARPVPASQPAQDIPFNEPLPEGITNTTTQFLALDKCTPRREFLQLLELPPISEQDGVQSRRPYRLQYDKEWLAILRVFSNDLQLGDPNASPSPDKGDAVYKPQIIEEEKWIEENVVKPGKLDVPENFTIIAPVYDPSVPITTQQMPLDYNNPQTAQFCELIGIENKFHVSEEDRQARAAAGPRPDHSSRGGGGSMRRGFGHGRGHGGGRGRGNRRY
ncbi:RNA lariat debranching enzyme [Aspergillus glaucus CBS 516.65]|uniref:Lariat debranching enzyme C-terminal domain-containing protein n=1 Tax=Aspergillus glaucus CBS 516.65 TaxID=1160497 RepID=A0A1L9VWP3_ASPGL|nr:hypothetical protein ASPGLDRAFT_63248 [Aspergillus glaucus CBS 516.65]OJJ88331.1 hypothetical protein ASPGLDRAFT_63248 [Aspergillus glaucus CBS 516.65]